MEHFLHVDHLIHDFGLTDVPGNSVEHERVDVRLELVRLHRRVDRLSPKLHCDFVRNELAFARVFQEGFADFRARVDGAKDVAASAMIVSAGSYRAFCPACLCRCPARQKGYKCYISSSRNTFIPQRQRQTSLSSRAKSTNPGLTRSSSTGLRLGRHWTSTQVKKKLRRDRHLRVARARSKRTFPSTSAKMV